MGRQVVIYSDELYHHGVKGQKWGIRRYQNPDGTLTKEGKRRYDARQDRINKNNTKIDRYTQKMHQDEKSLRNVERYGIKSKDFLERLEEYDEYYDPETGELVPGKKAYYIDTQPDESFSTKDEALEYLIRDLGYDIESGRSRIEGLRRQNKILMDAPLSSKTFLENEKRGRKIGSAVGLATGIGATVGLGVMGGPFVALLGLPFAAVAGISAGLKTQNKVENHGVRKEYRRN